MNEFKHDILHALRLIRRYPGYAALSVFTLSLGIGLVVGQFSFTNGVFYKGLPFEESDEIVVVERVNVVEGDDDSDVPIHDFEQFRAQQTTFEGLTAYYAGTVNLRDGREPVRLDGAYISTNFLQVLGEAPVFGRGFTESEGAPGAPLTALVSHHVWQDYFGADQAVLGRAVTINGRQATIVGVLPEGFLFPEAQEIWIPLPLHASEISREQPRFVSVFGRLKDGVSERQANADLTAIAARLAAAWPETHADWRAATTKNFVKSQIGDDAETIFLLMLFLVFLVLVIACANVANLSLARAMQRRRELAIRSSLGANRTRLIRQMVTETTVLAVLGAAGGLLIAHFGLEAIGRYVAVSQPPFWINFSLDWRVLLFTCTVTLLAGVLSGIIPAIRASKIDLNTLMKDSGRGSSLFLGRFARTLTVLQIGVSCALIFAAFLAVKDVLQLANRDYGFDTEAYLTGRIGLFEEAYPDAGARLDFYDDLLQYLVEHPAVANASLSSRYRFEAGAGLRVEIDGETYYEDDRRPFARSEAVSPGYFDLMCGGLLAGREFLPTDSAEGQKVAIVNETFARLHWPNQSPLGRRLRLQGDDTEWLTVVGVAPDLAMDGTSDYHEDHGQGFYQPLTQNVPNFTTMIVLPRGGDPMALAPVLQEAVLRHDPDLPVYAMETIATSLNIQQRILRLMATLFAVFGGAAIFLAAVGIYGVMAFSVRQRIQEIGIRMALGATPGKIYLLIAKSGAVQLAVGLGLGLLLGYLISGPLSLILEMTGPDDTGVIVASAVVVFIVVAFAIFFPARRAAAVVPMRVLRSE